MFINNEHFLSNMLEKIFTKYNLEILKLVMKAPTHIRSIAESVKCSPAKVHGSVGLFKKWGIVSETRDKNRVIISLNTEDMLVKKIRSLINTEALMSSQSFKQ